MKYMQTTLPFFAFVSLHVIPYVNPSLRDEKAMEYLSGSDKIQMEKMAYPEEPAMEKNSYNNERVW